MIRCSRILKGFPFLFRKPIRIMNLIVSIQLLQERLEIVNFAQATNFGKGKINERKT
ncbi:MAG: hypothetical protein ABIK93_04575 [candidate division WOR-3 bacterium]